MLAGIRDYFHLWQLPLFLILGAGWLIGGGRLLLRSIKQRQYSKRMHLGRCVLISLLSGLAGVIAAAAFSYLVLSIGKATDTNLKIAAGAVGLVVLMATAYFVIYAMLELSFSSALKAAALPLTAQIIMLIIVGSAAGVPAHFIRQSQLSRIRCRNNMSNYLAVAIRMYERTYETPPPDIKALLNRNLMDSNKLNCPAAPEDTMGYFYYPTHLIDVRESSEQIAACDVRGNHSGGRNVLLSNGYTRWYDEEELQVLLSQPQNEEFAAVLNTAESK